MNTSIIFTSIILIISSAVNIANGMAFKSEEIRDNYVKLNYIISGIGIVTALYLAIAWGFKRILTF